MAEKLTRAQRELLALVAKERVSIYAAADRLNTTAAAISRARALLLSAGLLAPWDTWDDAMEVTPAGRLALEAEEPRT